MRFGSGKRSPIAVRLVNLGGSWGNGGKMGVSDPMMDTFNYPKNNQGGNSQVILSSVPPGSYDVYIYGHGTDPKYFGDYTLSVGSRSYGRKRTSTHGDAVQNVKWVEGSQYVKFPAVQVKADEDILVLIQPGTASVRDAMINGLQLIPVKK
jgi:hypothetical protein